jgi:hypothetical protein
LDTSIMVRIEFSFGGNLIFIRLAFAPAARNSSATKEWCSYWRIFSCVYREIIKRVCVLGLLNLSEVSAAVVLILVSFSLYMREFYYVLGRLLLRWNTVLQYYNNQKKKAHIIWAYCVGRHTFHPSEMEHLTVVNCNISVSYKVIIWHYLSAA